MTYTPTVDVVQDVLLAIVGTEGLLLLVVMLIDNRYRRLRDRERKIEALDREIEEYKRARDSSGSTKLE